MIMKELPVITVTFEIDKKFLDLNIKLNKKTAISLASKPCQMFNRYFRATTVG